MSLLGSQIASGVWSLCPQKFSDDKPLTAPPAPKGLFQPLLLWRDCHSGLGEEKLILTCHCSDV